MSIFRQLWADANRRWGQLPLSERRRSLLVAVLVPLAALTAYDARPRTEPYEALASGLSTSESAVVRDHLETRHVPYVLVDGGQTVMVPASHRAEMTVELTRVAAVKGRLLTSAAVLERSNAGLFGSGRATVQARRASEN